MTVLWIETGCKSAGGQWKNLANLTCRNQYMSWETDVFHQLIFSVKTYYGTVCIQSNGANCCIASTTQNWLGAMQLSAWCISAQTSSFTWRGKWERVPDPKTPALRTLEKLDQPSLWFNGQRSSETIGMGLTKSRGLKDPLASLSWLPGGMESNMINCLLETPKARPCLTTQVSRCDGGVMVTVASQQKVLGSNLPPDLGLFPLSSQKHTDSVNWIIQIASRYKFEFEWLFVSALVLW